MVSNGKGSLAKVTVLGPAPRAFVFPNLGVKQNHLGFAHRCEMEPGNNAPRDSIVGSKPQFLEALSMENIKIKMHMVKLQVSPVATYFSQLPDSGHPTACFRTRLILQLHELLQRGESSQPWMVVHSFVYLNSFWLLENSLYFGAKYDSLALWK